MAKKKFKDFPTREVKPGERSEEQQKQIESEASIVKDAMEAGKILLRNRETIRGLCEINIGGLRLFLTDKRKVLELFDNEIEQANKWIKGENTSFETPMIRT